MPHRKHLCIVDNDRIYQFTVKKTLELMKSDCRLSIFSDGLEAIAFLRNCLDCPDDTPDIILLDLKMPMLDGWGFLKEYSKFHDELGREVQLYFTTSSIDDSDRKRALENPVVNGFMDKPVSYHDLQEVFAKLQITATA